MYYRNYPICRNVAIFTNKPKLIHVRQYMHHYYVNTHTHTRFITSITGPDGAVAQSSTKGLVGTGYQLQPGSGFKGSMGRCKATTPSFSLTSNGVIINLLS